MKSMRAAPWGEISSTSSPQAWLLGVIVAALANSIFCGWQDRDIGGIGDAQFGV
jgi:hypothetical protein